MKLTLSFVGPIRRPWPEMKREIEVEGGTSLEQLLISLGYRPEDLGRVIITVNGIKKTPSAEPADGDDVCVVLLAGGG